MVKSTTNFVRVRRLAEHRGGYYNTWELNSAHPVPQDPADPDYYWTSFASDSSKSDTSSTSGKLWF